MNKQLADAAVAAITNDSFEKKAGYCQRFAREVIESVYPGKYDRYFMASAKSTALKLLQEDLAFWTDSATDPQVGDVVYKITDAGPFGHVGIAVPDGGGGVKIAENSSTPLGRVSGAKGYRTWAQWNASGRAQAIWRIAGDGQTTELRLNNKKITAMPTVAGEILCPVRLWADALGFACDWDAATSHVIFDGHEVDAGVTIIDGHGYLPIEKLASEANLRVAISGHIASVTR